MYYGPKVLITQAIEHLTEQELSEFAQFMVNDLNDMSLLLRGEFDFSSFLDNGHQIFDTIMICDRSCSFI